MDSSKTDKYKRLVKEARSGYEVYCENSTNTDKKLYWCKECEEINLWSYWQGRGNLDAEILLVGQDWGNPWDKSNQNFMSKLKSVGSGPMQNYMDGNDNPTDLNLIELFNELEIDITVPCKRVFFTNFVLGYRNYNISGGYKKSWARKDEKYFKKLTHIIEPNIILCLGRATFEAVIHALQPEMHLSIGKYNSFIESKRNPIIINLENGHELAVFALSHCGAIGTMNRNRGHEVKVDKLDLQRRDWRRINTFIKKEM